jgi:hypothetical protein
MKNKVLRLFFISLVGLTSCDNSEEVQTIKVTEPPKEIILNVSQNIDGAIGSFGFASKEKVTMKVSRIEDGSFPGFSFEVPIKLNFIKGQEIKAGRGYNSYGPNLMIEFLDKHGNSIPKVSGRMSLSFEALAELIKPGNKEETILFSGSYTLNTYSNDKIYESSKEFIDAISKASIIKITSEIIEEKIETVSNSKSEENLETTSNSNSGKVDCDKFLKQYEELVMEYLKIAKKAQENPNNTAILGDLTKALQKANNMSSGLADCKDSKVVQKMMELQVKMSNAMLN